MSEMSELNLNKLIGEATECPSFIADLIDFCNKHDPKQLREIIDKYKNMNELIEVSDIDYDKIKNI